MSTRRFFLLFWVVILVLSVSPQARALQSVPESLYPDLEYLFSVPTATLPFASEQVSGIVGFVATTASDTSLSMKDRNSATGAFHSFSVRGDLAKVVEYVYNPDIPSYVTMPSSVRGQEWQTTATRDALKQLPNTIRSGGTVLLRGSEQETITPDANTGGYYSYRQDRAVAVFRGPTGPVLVSVGCQPTPSEIGKKGCVVGEDTNWNYLYSDEKGLTKTGLGWVDSYMYNAHSVLVLVADEAAGIVRVGSFKWLNAGWAKVNMVKEVHIINGIKRFAADFKAVLESARLPKVQDLVSKYRELAGESPENLRQMVAPYLQAVAESGDAEVSSSPFKKLLASGEYLQTMSRQEMVRVVLQEFIKKQIGRDSLIQVAEGIAPGTSRQ